MASAAVNPAVPKAIASNKERAGRQRHHPVRRNTHVIGKAAVMRHAHVVAGDQHCIARLEARILRRLHHPGDIHAAYTGKTTDDFARPRRGECVLVIDSGVMRTDDDLARVEIVERQLDEAALRFAVFFEDAIGAKHIHHRSSNTRPGNSSASLMEARNNTASRPSMMRWS